MATPVFECLRHNFPEAEITALIRPYAKGIIEDSPWFDHIVDCQDKNFSGMRKIRNELKKLNPKAGLLLTNTTHSYLTFRLAGVPQIFGYKRNLRKHFLTGGPLPKKEGRKYKPLPMQDYYLELCRYLDLTLPELPRAKLYMSSELVAEGSNLLSSYGIQQEDKVVGINPGASFGSSKCWPTDYFARLCEMLQSQFNCKLLLLVGPGEEEIATQIENNCSADIINTATDQINLAALKPLVKRCNLLITNDTGPRHYAVALNVPNIVLMGPTNPLYTTSNLEYTTVLRRDLPCVPCHKKACPLGHHACMKEITPEMVFAEASSILAGEMH